MTDISEANAPVGKTVGAPRRSGGRAARTAARSAPLPTDMRPIKAGMSGGRYKPLTDEDMARIHEGRLACLRGNRPL